MAEPKGGRGGQKGGKGGGYALPPDYGRSVNPIKTEGQIIIPKCLLAPHIFRYSTNSAFKSAYCFLNSNQKLHTSLVMIFFIRLLIFSGYFLWDLSNRIILCSKLKNGLCKIVTKSQVVTKSRLHCISALAYKKRSNQKSSVRESKWVA